MPKNKTSTPIATRSAGGRAATEHEQREGWKLQHGEIWISRLEHEQLLIAGIKHGNRVADTTEAARFLQVTPGTMRNWRTADVGPKFKKVGRTGRLVRYPTAGLILYKRKLEAGQ